MEVGQRVPNPSRPYRCFAMLQSAEHLFPAFFCLRLHTTLSEAPLREKLLPLPVWEGGI